MVCVIFMCVTYLGLKLLKLNYTIFLSFFLSFMQPFTLEEIYKFTVYCGFIIIACSNIFPYIHKWLTMPTVGIPPGETMPHLTEFSELNQYKDNRLRAILQHCCAVREAPFADQIATLPYQSCIDDIYDILQSRTRYSVEHRRLVAKLPLSLDVLQIIETFIFSMPSNWPRRAPPASRFFCGTGCLECRPLHSLN